MRILAAPAFHTAYLVIPVIAFAHMTRSLAFQLEIGILVSKRTIYRVLTIGSSVVVDVGLCFVLIPRYGAMGAAWATAAAFTFLAVVSYIVSNRLFPVVYDFKSVIVTIVSGIGIYGVSTLVQIDNHIASILVNTLFLLAYPVVLLILGIWNIEDIDRVKSTLFQFKRSAA